MCACACPSWVQAVYGWNTQASATTPMPMKHLWDKGKTSRLRPNATAYSILYAKALFVSCIWDIVRDQCSMRYSQYPCYTAPSGVNRHRSRTAARHAEESNTSEIHTKAPAISLCDATIQRKYLGCELWR